MLYVLVCSVLHKRAECFFNTDTCLSETLETCPASRTQNIAEAQADAPLAACSIRTTTSRGSAVSLNCTRYFSTISPKKKKKHQHGCARQIFESHRQTTERTSEPLGAMNRKRNYALQPAPPPSERSHLRAPKTPVCKGEILQSPPTFSGK